MHLSDYCRIQYKEQDCTLERSQVKSSQVKSLGEGFLARQCDTGVQFSYYINNRQPSLSNVNVLSRLAVGVRVDGDDETQRKEHEREGDQEETRHRVLACVPSVYR